MTAISVENPLRHPPHRVRIQAAMPVFFPPRDTVVLFKNVLAVALCSVFGFPCCMPRSVGGDVYHQEEILRELLEAEDKPPFEVARHLDHFRRCFQEDGELPFTMRQILEETIRWTLRLLGVPEGVQKQPMRLQSPEPMDLMETDDIVFNRKVNYVEGVVWREMETEGERIEKKVLEKLELLYQKGLLQRLRSRYKEGITAVCLLAEREDDLLRLFYENRQGWQLVFDSWATIFDETKKISDMTEVAMPDIVGIDRRFTDVFNDENLDKLRRQAGLHDLDHDVFRQRILQQTFAVCIPVMEAIERRHAGQKHSRKGLGIAALHRACQAVIAEHVQKPDPTEPSKKAFAALYELNRSTLYRHLREIDRLQDTVSPRLPASVWEDGPLGWLTAICSRIISRAASMQPS